MEYKFEKFGRTLAVAIAGELDHHNAAGLRESMDNELLTGGANNLIIDLSRLELMDSSGIGLIMGRYKLVNSLGGKLCVSGASPSVNKVIELSGLDKLILLCKSSGEAIKKLKGGSK